MAYWLSTWYCVALRPGCGVWAGRLWRLGRTTVVQFSPDWGLAHMSLIVCVLMIQICGKYVSVCGFGLRAHGVFCILGSGVLRDHFGYGLSQWEMMLHGNVISHWLSPCPEWSLCIKWYHVATIILASGSPGLYDASWSVSVHVVSDIHLTWVTVWARGTAPLSLQWVISAASQWCSSSRS